MTDRSLRLLYRQIPSSSSCVPGCFQCCGPVTRPANGPHIRASVLPAFMASTEYGNTASTRNIRRAGRCSNQISGGGDCLAEEVRAALATRLNSLQLRNHGIPMTHETTEYERGFRDGVIAASGKIAEHYDAIRKRQAKMQSDMEQANLLMQRMILSELAPLQETVRRLEPAQ